MLFSFPAQEIEELSQTAAVQHCTRRAADLAQGLAGLTLECGECGECDLCIAAASAEDLVVLLRRIERRALARGAS